MFEKALCDDLTCVSENANNNRLVISPTHKRTEGRAPVWGSEFTSKDAAIQEGSEKLLLG